MSNSASKPALTLNDAVFSCMFDFKPWTFWELQEEIKNRHGRFYGEPTISAANRNLRKDDCRERYNLPRSGKVFLMEPLVNGRGHQYRLNPQLIQYINKGQ